MKKLLNIIFLTSLSLVCLTSSAQREAPPEGGTPRDFQLPAKRLQTLPNGLKSVSVQYGAIPKVDVSLIIKTGNIHEGPNEVWLSDLAGHLIREGTSTLDFKAISKKAASMGGTIGISTGLNQMTLSGSVLSEFAPDLIKLLAEIIINPAFPASELDRLKNDLKRQLSIQHAVPQNQATEKFRSIIYKGHSYGQYFPTESMLDGYSIEMARGFYDKNVGAKRTVVYVVGKFNGSAVEKAIEEAFSKWKSGPDVNFPIAKPVRTNEVAILDRPGAPQTNVMLGLPTLDPSQPDYLPLQVTNSILGGSFGSRITSNIREDKGYTYSPRSVINAGYRVAIWYEEADITTEHTGAALGEISKEIKRMQSEPLSKEELKGIQNYEAGIFVLQNSTPGGIVSQLNFLDFHGLDDAYLTNRVKNIYSVTPEKIQQMAKDYFKYENMTLVLVGDKKQLDKQIKANRDAHKVK